MPSLRAQHLGFAFDPLPLFEDLTFHLTTGWTGLVGANGLGKTTLLRLLLRELEPVAGALVIEPAEARIVLCPQRIDAKDALLDDFGAAYDGVAGRLKGRLELDDGALERWSTLSPGERKRWQLGAALWSEPDVLLLDEPSNHLDAAGLALLRGALADFDGLGVLVSHDRALLDDVTSATLRLEAGGARLWHHPYSRARELWLEDEASVRETQRALKTRLGREEQKLEARRSTLASATKQRSTGERMKSRHDSDARTLGADFRAEQAERAHAATLRRVERQATRVRDALAQVHVVDEAGQALFLRYEPCPRPTVVQFHGDLRAGDTVLARDLSVQLVRDGRLWVKGPNGCGKSTLLRAVLEAGCVVPEDRRLVLPQELRLDESVADLALLRALPDAAKGRVLQLVHALGVEPDRLLRSQAPSPGEARKLRLALGLGRSAWLAVLDEPTNHFNLPAIERLGEALAAFPGALLLVTHDEQLGRTCHTEVLEL